MKRLKIWVGCSNLIPWEVFRCDFTPAKGASDPGYFAVIGPFKTVRGAKWMARYGKNNPHGQTVDEAERIAKVEMTRQLCPSCGGTGGIGHCNRCNASGYVSKGRKRK